MYNNRPSSYGTGPNARRTNHGDGYSDGSYRDGASVDQNSHLSDSYSKYSENGNVEDGLSTRTSSYPSTAVSTTRDAALLETPSFRQDFQSGRGYSSYYQNDISSRNDRSESVDPTQNATKPEILASLTEKWESIHGPGTYMGSACNNKYKIYRNNDSSTMYYVDAKGNHSWECPSDVAEELKELSLTQSLDKYSYERLDGDMTGSWVPPSVAKALEYRENEVFGGGHLPLRSDSTIFAPLGVGVVLYFKLLAWLVFVFLAMTIVYLPIWAIYVSGNRIGSRMPDPIMLASISLGNIGPIEWNHLSTLYGNVSINSTSFDINILRNVPSYEAAGNSIGDMSLYGNLSFFNPELSNLTYLSIPAFNINISGEIAGLVITVSDLVAVFILLIFSVLFRKKTKRLSDVAASKSISAADYSVYVTNLPPNTTVEEVRDHFSALFALDGTGVDSSGHYDQVAAAIAQSELDTKPAIRTASSQDMNPLSSPSFPGLSPSQSTAPTLPPAIPLPTPVSPSSHSELKDLAHEAMNSMQSRRAAGIISSADVDVRVSHRIEIMSKGKVHDITHNGDASYLGSWVADVCISRPVTGLISTFASSEKLSYKLRSARALVKMYSDGTPLPSGPDKSKREKYMKEVSRLEAKLETLFNLMEDRTQQDPSVSCIGSAFVTFNCEESRSRCLKAYAGSSSSFLRTFQAPYLRFRNSHSPAVVQLNQKMRGMNASMGLTNLALGSGSSNAPTIRGYALRVVPAPDPSDVLHENLGVTKCNRCMRITGTYIVTLLLVALGLAVMVLAQSYTKSFASSAPNEDLCNVHFPATYFGSYERLQLAENAIFNGMEVSPELTLAPMDQYRRLSVSPTSWSDSQGQETLVPGNNLHGSRRLNHDSPLTPDPYTAIRIDANLESVHYRAAARITRAEDDDLSDLEDSLCPAGTTFAGYRYSFRRAAVEDPFFASLSDPQRFAYLQNEPTSALGNSVRYAIDHYVNKTFILEDADPLSFFHRMPGSATSHLNANPLNFVADSSAGPVHSGGVRLACTDDYAWAYVLRFYAIRNMTVPSAGPYSRSAFSALCPDPRVVLGGGSYCPCVSNSKLASSALRCPTLSCFLPPSNSNNTVIANRSSTSLSLYDPAIASALRPTPSTSRCLIPHPDALNACFCIARKASYAADDSVLGFLKFTLNEREPCGRFILSSFLTQLLVLASALAAAIVNVLLSVVIPRLTKLEGHLSHLQENRAVAMKVALAQTINTGFTALLVNARAPPGVRVPPFLLSVGILNGQFMDFNGRWYSIVVTTIGLTAAVNALIPPLRMAIEFVTDSCSRRKIRGKLGAVATQRELDELFVGSRVIFPRRYPLILTMLYVSLLYSPALPALLPLAALGFSLQFVVDKFMLLRFYRKPSTSSTVMTILFLEAVPFAVALHCGFAAWMLSARLVLPARVLTVNDVVSLWKFFGANEDTLLSLRTWIGRFIAAYLDFGDPLHMLARASHFHTLPFTALLAVIIAVVLVIFFWRLLRGIFLLTYRSLGCGVLVARLRRSHSLQASSGGWTGSSKVHPLGVQSTSLSVVSSGKVSSNVHTNSSSGSHMVRPHNLSSNINSRYADSKTKSPISNNNNNNSDVVEMGLSRTTMLTSQTVASKNTSGSADRLRDYHLSVARNAWTAYRSLTVSLRYAPTQVLFQSFETLAIQTLLRLLAGPSAPGSRLFAHPRLLLDGESSGGGKGLSPFSGEFAMPHNARLLHGAADVDADEDGCLGLGCFGCRQSHTQRAKAAVRSRVRLTEAEVASGWRLMLYDAFSFQDPLAGRSRQEWHVLREAVEARAAPKGASGFVLRLLRTAQHVNNPRAAHHSTSTSQAGTPNPSSSNSSSLGVGNGSPTVPNSPTTPGKVGGSPAKEFNFNTLTGGLPSLPNVLGNVSSKSSYNNANTASAMLRTASMNLSMNTRQNPVSPIHSAANNSNGNGNSGSNGKFQFTVPAKKPQNAMGTHGSARGGVHAAGKHFNVADHLSYLDNVCSLNHSRRVQQVADAACGVHRKRSHSEGDISDSDLMLKPSFRGSEKVSKRAIHFNSNAAASSPLYSPSSGGSHGSAFSSKVTPEQRIRSASTPTSQSGPGGFSTPHGYSNKSAGGSEGVEAVVFSEDPALAGLMRPVHMKEPPPVHLQLLQKVFRCGCFQRYVKRRVARSGVSPVLYVLKKIGIGARIDEISSYQLNRDPSKANLSISTSTPNHGETQVGLDSTELLLRNLNATKVGYAKRSWEVIKDHGLSSYDLVRNPRYSHAFALVADMHKRRVQALAASDDDTRCDGTDTVISGSADDFSAAGHSPSHSKGDRR